MTEESGTKSSLLAETLSTSLALGGTCPAIAATIDQLKGLAARDASADDLAAVLVCDPVLCTQLFQCSAVRSSLLEQSQPFELGVAIDRFGKSGFKEFLKTIAASSDLFSSFRHAEFLRAIAKLHLMTILIAGNVSSADGRKDPSSKSHRELAASLSMVGLWISVLREPESSLLLTKPGASAISLDDGFAERFGSRPMQLSADILAKFEIPPFWMPKPGDVSSSFTSSAVSIGRQIAIAIHREEREILATTLLTVDAADRGQEGSVSGDSVREALALLPNLLGDREKMLGLSGLTLPPFVVAFAQGRGGGTFRTAQIDLGATLSTSIEEIRSGISAGLPLQHNVVSVMELVAWSIGFDRVLFLQADTHRHVLTNTLALGSRATAGDISRSTSLPDSDENPDIRAFRSGTMVIGSACLLAGGTFSVVLPVGYGNHCQGVIYADCLRNGAGISEEHRAALQMLADLLDSCARSTSKP